MPAVSVVIATYNRSNVLRYTIESLIAQTFADWEAIVVGDACTDDTADVVASFGDPRIRFINLDRNHGEQSAPNNAGVRIARGRFVAFLNHDDLWTREHLALCVNEIESADVVYTLTISMNDSGVFLSGLSRDGRYDPLYAAPASSWLVRREAFDVAGEWRDARTINLAPSQEWLSRASKKGLRIRAVPRATVVAVQSVASRNAYRNRDFVLNRDVAASLRDDPDYIEKLLTQMAMTMSIRWRGRSVAPLLARAAKNAFLRLTLFAGTHPNAIRHRKRGAGLNHLRRIRGLPPLGEPTP